MHRIPTFNAVSLLSTWKNKAADRNKQRMYNIEVLHVLHVMHKYNTVSNCIVPSVPMRSMQKNCLLKAMFAISCHLVKNDSSLLTKHLISSKLLLCIFQLRIQIQISPMTGICI